MKELLPRLMQWGEGRRCCLAWMKKTMAQQQQQQQRWQRLEEETRHSEKMPLLACQRHQRSLPRFLPLCWGRLSLRPRL